MRPVSLTQTIFELTHGWAGLGLVYGSVQVPMAASMLRKRAPLERLIRSPKIAVPLAVAAGIATSYAYPFMKSIGLGGEVAQFFFGVSVCASLGYLGGSVAARSESRSVEHQRGTVILDAASAGTRSHERDDISSRHIGKSLGTAKPPSVRARNRLTLAGLALAPQDETKHFKIVGTTGTGKSTAIRELLSGALARGDRAVVADPDYGYTRRFYDPGRGDLILNPFDANSVKWDLFGEITEAYDIDQLARSLIVDQGGPDRSWGQYSRTFFAAVTRTMHEQGESSLSELNRLLVEAGTEELRLLVRGTAAQPFLQESNARMFDSVRSITSSAVGPLAYIAQQQTELFSIRKWIQGRDDTRGGVLFIPYRAGQIAALRSTVSAWMRIAIFEAMNRPEEDQRLWFVVDELDALGQIDGLKDALARLRKFGGRCVLGFQSAAQVSGTYGSCEAQTIVENTGNTMILRCAGSEHGGTSHFASRLIGQREVLRETFSSSRRSNEWISSRTRSEHFSIEPAVLDSEIEQLPDLAGYLKFASEAQWRRVRLAPDYIPEQRQVPTELQNNLDVHQGLG
jgi:hypothetical protein